MKTLTSPPKKGLYFVLGFILCFTTSYSQKESARSPMKKVNTHFLDNGKKNTASTPTTEMLMGAPIYQINAGGWQVSGDWEKDSWASPSPYVNNGIIGFNSANGPNDYFFSTKSRVNNSSADMEWDFPITIGNYIVTLYFAEGPTTSQVIGSRVFDVEIEGRKALDDFDITSFTGIDFTAYLYFALEVTDGNLDIDFITETGSSLITAIEINAGIPSNLDPIINHNAFTLNYTMREGAELRLPVRAIDFDSPSSAIILFGDKIFENLNFMTFFDYGDGYGEAIFKPGFNDASIYGYAYFIASEDEDGLDTGCNACWAVGEIDVLNTPEGDAVYRVNAGDWKTIDAGTAAPWEKDTYAQPSQFVNNNEIGFKTASHTILSNSTDAPDGVFFKSRVNESAQNMIWEFPVTNADYTVKLYFVESSFNVLGSRVFDVTVEGATVLNHFDILSEVGKNVPLQKNIPTHVTDGNLTIAFQKRVANPIIAAIDITYGNITTTELTTFNESNINTVEANQQLSREVLFYPNPVENQLTIILPQAQAGNVDIKLLDSHNQIRYNAHNYSNLERNQVSYVIDADLPTGIYFVEVIIKDQKSHFKIIKK